MRRRRLVEALHVELSAHGLVVHVDERAVRRPAAGLRAAAGLLRPAAGLPPNQNLLNWM